MESNRIVGGYIRVSTEMQIERDSIINQEETITQWTRSKGRAVKIFKDAGVSARDKDRPALKALIDDVKNGKIDTIVVTSLDRITRSLKDLIFLKDLFEQYDVSFVSISQNLDTSTSMGRFVFHILGSLAELEREVIAERVSENMKGRARRKKWNGGVVPFGYEYKDKTLVPEEREARVIKKVYELYLKLKSFRGVVHRLNSLGLRTRVGKPWPSTTVKRILQNPVYCGSLTYAKRKSVGKTSKPIPADRHIIIDGVFEPIIAKDRFNQVQALIRNRRVIPPAVMGSKYLLSGLVQCGFCGYRFYGYTERDKRRKKESIRRYYRCNGHIQRGSAICPGNTIRMEELDKTILEELKGFAVNPARLKELVLDSPIREKESEVANSKRVMEEKLKKIEIKKSRLLELYEEAVIGKEEFIKERERLEAERISFETALYECQDGGGMQIARSIDMEQLLDSIKSLWDVSQELTVEEKRELLRTIFAEIKVKNKKVEYTVFGLPGHKFARRLGLHGCPCGYHGDPTHDCSCNPAQIQKYMSRISGPLLDRIDIHIEVPAVKFKELSGQPTGEKSSAIRERVNRARQIQLERFKNEKHIFCNAHMESKEIGKYCQIDEKSLELLRMAITKLGLSARAFDRIKKVSRTIADLEGLEEILPQHISEGIQYRSLDRNLWM